VGAQLSAVRLDQLGERPLVTVGGQLEQRLLVGTRACHHHLPGSA